MVNDLIEYKGIYHICFMVSLGLDYNCDINKKSHLPKSEV